ncbi:UPF0149 family protein [Microbulbifer thermotolerans]|uniref:UPF0149 family protein n=1 Tax=Microbulbifer thermotolerans TaxID=252514 RepID=A0A143HPB8_MICTH|nr:UPF0149 family protein [Microbulbifer thermotolerans]AMX03563.1 hypothetical protein A3224_14135 [Microbulbifer thermotolerans]MCX2778189.1 UPF0149 family protein [Microbulbifer thermotolerans]MCX2782177.1 UPF0149 family protein [Microbulbifer thermotolerans]MCX2795269.1 UPF0149 family protein [Microbulbifer thermotolerans]MCX2801169.1 UPF0149 family protein [Microbulbifer thermotolerans]
MTRAAIEFETLANAILAAGGEADPSELHGFVCGVLAAGTTPDKSRWQKELGALLELDAVPADLNRDFLQLARESELRLQDSDFDFQLLLSEDEDIGARTLALGHWCQGFLHGFGVGAHRGELQPTSKEALRDIGAIAQVDAEGAEQTEEAENQLLELQEYVRVAVLNIFTEVRGKKTGPTVH